MIEEIDGEKYCNGKKCYSKERADKVKHACMKARNRRMRVYECGFCFYYHLTSQKKETNLR
jgi:hypothetical protein